MRNGVDNDGDGACLILLGQEVEVPLEEEGMASSHIPPAKRGRGRPRKVQPLPVTDAATSFPTSMVASQPSSSFTTRTNEPPYSSVVSIELPVDRLLYLLCRPMVVGTRLLYIPLWTARSKRCSLSYDGGVTSLHLSSRRPHHRFQLVAPAAAV